MRYLEVLEKRGQTLRDFADRIGVSATHVANVFKKKTNASAETEAKIRHELENCPWCRQKWPEPVVFDDEKPTAKRKG
jgi:transcriptional regulator with XRE-family HTH domain